MRRTKGLFTTMRRLVLCFAAAAALSAAFATPTVAQPRRSAAAAPAADANYRLGCNGVLGPRTTLADLRRIYGAANVRNMEVNAVEGEMVQATVLFDNDETRRAEIFWNDSARHTGFTSIRTGGRRWVTSHGLRPGSPIADVERVNGRPFPLSGFGWDYGGAPDFTGGRLAPPAGLGCFISYDLSPAENSTSTEALGEGTFQSNSRAVRSQRPVVGRVTLSFSSE